MRKTFEEINTFGKELSEQPNLERPVIPVKPSTPDQTSRFRSVERVNPGSKHSRSILDQLQARLDKERADGSALKNRLKELKRSTATGEVPDIGRPF